MNTSQRTAGSRGFTLIELLVVISIIAILAGLLLPAAMGVKRRAAIKRVEGELAQLATAIERYQLDLGFYPPQNEANANATQAGLYFSDGTPAAENSLYYELSGVTVEGPSGDERYVTPANDRVTKSDLKDRLGLGGVMNSSAGANESNAKNYLAEFKPTQSSTAEGGLVVVSTSLDGPISTTTGASPFCYVNGSQWQRNTATFDLWVDVIMGSKTNRISNWSDEPETVTY